MVNEQDLYEILTGTGLPVAYGHFKEPPAPPYLVYLFSFSLNFGADNKVYERGNNYQVELYSNKKDLESEALVESVLDTNDIYWDKTETYIDSEGLYQVLYEI